MKKHLGVFTLLLALGISLSISAQMTMKMPPKPPINWKNKCLSQDSLYGTGSDSALSLLKGRKPVTVVVAVLDAGVYINHPALKGEIWTNPKEIPGNGIDDDSNGYVDDVHGWNFIGGKVNGRDTDVRYANLELTRLYRYYTQKFSDVPRRKIPKDEMSEYNRYIKIKGIFEARRDKVLLEYTSLKGFTDSVSLLKTALDKKDITPQDVEKYTPPDSSLAYFKRRLLNDFKRFRVFIHGATADTMLNLFGPVMKELTEQVKYEYNVDFNPRWMVNDDYADASQRYYGNNDVVGPTDFHATHVSGIIAAVRNAGPGKPEGIANDVKIMVIRVVPDGDERDKDVANGIRYAVEMGAKIINMSFGKEFAYNKKAVDEAVKYAEAHDVLLVHAAGNSHNNNDSVDNFPNPRFEGTHKVADDWIEVGASDSKGKPAEFSNYGKKTVDLFAPGVDIYSSVPDTGYAYLSGTSMATPCVSGVAAILREYFPKLTAVQVRKILMESVTKINVKVPMPGHPGKMVKYSDLCKTGGIINACKAVQLALKESK